MMNKRKNPIRSTIGLVGAIMAIGFIVFACSAPSDQEAAIVDNMNAAETAGDVFTVVETMPLFPGGMEGLSAYLATNINYPEAAKENDVSGKVIVSFIVEKDGSVSNTNVVRGIGSGCDEESVRVVSEMPKWAPGMQRGERVRVSFNLPINFQLDPKETDSVFTVVDEMPEFPGGNKALMSYLGENIKYPEQAKKDKITGRVFVSFVVENDGRVTNVKTLRGIGGGCDEESIRVISSMPNWAPGKDENGKAVRVRYNIPIKFSLD